jgi:glycerol-3-phosphate dehydrogenase (NAD(P)+)
MTIGVIGAGAWGTALAQMLASDGSNVLLWAREAEVACCHQCNATKIRSICRAFPCPNDRGDV